MSVERGPARWGAVAVIPGRVVAGGQLVKLHPNCRIATLISRDEVATSAEGMYGSLRHLVKPILEKISVATRTWTASLKPTNSSLVPTSLKTWYPRSLLLTGVCEIVLAISLARMATVAACCALSSVFHTGAALSGMGGSRRKLNCCMVDLLCCLLCRRVCSFRLTFQSID